MSVVIQIPSHSKSFTYFFWYCLKWQHILVLIFFHTKKICLPILCQFFYTGNWARKKRNTNSLPYREVHLQWSLNYHLRIEYLSFYYMIIFFTLYLSFHVLYRLLSTLPHVASAKLLFLPMVLTFIWYWHFVQFIFIISKQHYSLISLVIIKLWSLTFWLGSFCWWTVCF